MTKESKQERIVERTKKIKKKEKRKEDVYKRKKTADKGIEIKMPCL